MFKSIYDLVSSQSDNLIALETPKEVKLTFQNLKKKIDESIKLLQSLSLANERIAIILPNGLGAAFSFLAVSSCAVSAPLNPNFKKEEFEFYIMDLNIKGILVEQDSKLTVVDVALEQGIKIIEVCDPDTDPTLIFSKKNFINHPPTKSFESSLTHKNNLALLLHTSGTTGKPKIVPLTHGNLCDSVENISNSLNLNSHDRGLNIMPLFHIHGIVASLLSPLSRGGTVICSKGFDALSFFHILIDLKPTFFSAVPTMHQLILDRGKRNRLSITKHSLRFLRSSSASMPEVLHKELEAFFDVPLLEAYGMTEASHQISSNTISTSSKLGSVGKIQPGKVGIFGPNNQLIDNNLLGEVVIKGKNVTNGYENNPMANEDSIINKWFKTGDQGMIDSEGFLFLKGRLKEIINKGGEKISPVEIDELITSHPDVAQAVAFSFPHSKLGEDVAVAIVLKEEKKLSQEDIKGYCLQKVVRYKVPSKIIFIDEIPKGPTGKPMRRNLASLLLGL